MSLYRPQIFGYADRWSARPGEIISFHVSTQDVENYRSNLVRLSHGYTGAQTPGFVESEIPSTVDRIRAGATYRCAGGSFVEMQDEHGVLGPIADVVFEVFIFPTLPGGSRRGYMDEPGTPR